MIQNFRHRGLKRLFEQDDRSKLPQADIETIEDILGLLNVAVAPQVVDLPGYGLRKLSGDLKGFWSVKVSKNYRIVFRFEGADAFDVDFLDYH